MRVQHDALQMTDSAAEAVNALVGAQVEGIGRGSRGLSRGQGNRAYCACQRATDPQATPDLRGARTQSGADKRALRAAQTAAISRWNRAHFPNVHARAQSH